MTQGVSYHPGAILHGPRGVSSCGALTDLSSFDAEQFAAPSVTGAEDLGYDDTMAQNTEGALLIGNSVDGRGSLNPHISMWATQAMIGATLDRTERFGALGVTGLWAGLVGETPDQLPIVDCVEGIYVNAGHSYGIASGPICGEIMAQIVSGEPSPLGRQLTANRASLGSTTGSGVEW